MLWYRRFKCWILLHDIPLHITDRELSLSGDNFAEFERYKPGAYAYLGTGNPDLPHTMITNHNGGFDVDENALVTGAGLYVGYTVARLG